MKIAVEIFKNGEKVAEISEQQLAEMTESQREATLKHQKLLGREICRIKS